VGAFSFTAIAMLLLGLYSYLDYQRLNQQETYPTPEDAFLRGRSMEEATIEFSTREFQTIAGIKIVTFDDVWFVAGRYNIDGDWKPTGNSFFRVDGGWVRVSEISATPFVVCAARRVRQEFVRLFGP